MSGKCIFLLSSLSSDQIQVVNTRRMEDVLTANKVVFEKIDGALPESKEMRDKLFAVSSMRGKYPQLFIEDNGTLSFVGMWEEVESLVDCNGLPADVLSANPGIKTLNQVIIATAVFKLSWH